MDSTAPEDSYWFLNVFGILRESIKILRSHAKLFSVLTVTLIVPLCLAGLGHNLVTLHLHDKIAWDTFLAGQQKPGTRAEEKTEERIHEETFELRVFFVLYLLFVLALSLVSTSAIVYSVACIYSDKIASYRNVLTVVPRVWKRLRLTFLWAILFDFLFVFLLVCATMLAAIALQVMFGLNVVGLQIFFWSMFVFGMAIHIYINCVWHLAYVITVLEESSGLAAIKKSLHLIKGKQLVGYCLVLIYAVCTFLIRLGIGMGVIHVDSHKIGYPRRVLLGCALLLLLSLVDLMGFLVQTMFYFTCKAYHNESIDRMALSDHLGGYLGEYVPLRGAIQLGDLEP